MEGKGDHGILTWRRRGDGKERLLEDGGGVTVEPIKSLFVNIILQDGENDGRIESDSTCLQSSYLESMAWIHLKTRIMMMIMRLT